MRVCARVRVAVCILQEYVLRHSNDCHPMVTINVVSPSVVHTDAQAHVNLNAHMQMHIHVHTGATAIAAGRRHSLILKDGTVWATGYNRQGQFGDISKTNANSLKPGPCGTMM